MARGKGPISTRRTISVDSIYAESLLDCQLRREESEESEAIDIGPAKNIDDMSAVTDPC